mmetsp:Transcript_3851/g.5267  ORF Transcript_3851/g.5267 Transcript_3851/m.5267 type:complete len:85 (+) Transcript_3851:614-868(+)
MLETKRSSSRDDTPTTTNTLAHLGDLTRLRCGAMMDNNDDEINSNSHITPSLPIDVLKRQHPKLPGGGGGGKVHHRHHHTRAPM